ncbi:hypothetical protein [Streptomyces echinatus]|uniref:Uncharacterized protein n=1 Tax=Streptomyces echinatus TaxID=67293 RepID=A0A7W9PS45_9ACTN|nr:hypothetical protein [Streptomyces echinatus]MBB5926796.1 hypothetical protein [Streptomyces echinatus]
MEASELTAWVMTLLTQASNGAAGAIGGAAGAEASRLVRERLGSSSEGRAALDPENGDPDEAARQVTAVLNADPGFAGRLERLHEAAQRQPSAAPYAGRDIYQASVGERAKNNTIAFGPLTLRKDRAPITVTALLLVVALVLGFAVYGLVQALSGDSRSGAHGTASGGQTGATDSDGSDVPWTGNEAAGGEGGWKDAPVRDLQLAKAILPDLRSMPAGWSLAEKAETQTVTSDSCSGDCGGLLSEGEVTYAVSGTSDQASIQVEAYETVDTAATGYEQRADNVGSGDSVASMSLEQLGDKSVAFSRQEYTGSEYTYAMATVVRAGTVVIRVTYGGGYDKLDSAVLSGIARMVTERARQAQNGEEPSATLTEAP